MNGLGELKKTMNLANIQVVVIKVQASLQIFLYQILTSLSQRYNGTKIIENVILDGLFDIGFDKDKGIRIELIAYSEHDVDSSEFAFYIAARTLIRSRKEMTDIYKNFTYR